MSTKPFQVATSRRVYAPYDAERYALKPTDVEIGDLVVVADTGFLWIVTDPTNLSSDSGYHQIGNTSLTPTFTNILINGTAGNGYVTYVAQSATPAAPANGFSEFADSLGRKSWIRASDGFVRTWDATLTGNRVYTLPDASGTLVLSGVNTQTGTLTIGSLLVGATGTASTTLQVVDTGTATPRGISHEQYNNGTNSAQINTRKARGTFATPLTIVSGDVLGRHIFWGHDGTAFIESANIRATSSGTVATNRVPSQLEFYTSTNAAPSVLTLALTLTSAQAATLAGNLTFGTSGSILNGTTGSIGLTAVGTNQSLTLTPTGTGQIVSGILGTAASPSLAWTGDLTTGLYSLGGGELGYSGSGSLRWKFSYGADGGGLILQPTSGSNFGFSAAGTGSIVFRPNNTLALTLNSTNATLVGNFTFGTSGSILNGTTGSIGLTATGANQSLIFTPSGTGVTKFVGASTNAFIGSDSSPAYADLWLGTATAGLTNFSLSSNGTLLQVNSAGAGPIQFSLANSEKARIAATTGNLLLAQTTDDGVNALQVTGSAALSSTIKTGGFVRVANDVTNATATMSSITNLSVTVVSGAKYIGTIQIFANDSTGADGLAFDLGGGNATFTDLEFGFAAQPTGSTLGTVTSTSSTTAITLTVVSTADAVYTISFSFTCNAGGTVIPRFAQNSHSTGTATVRKNSATITLASTN